MDAKKLSTGTNSISSASMRNNDDDDSSSMDSSSNEDTPKGDDAERVWSSDIEQSFQEALAIYPPCGRRKIILSDEGKMYGRNELIARYIKLRTGKHRSRKQVSSHIQVLARKKAREIKNNLKATENPSNRERTLQAIANMSSAQIVSASAMFNNILGPTPNLPTTSVQTGQSTTSNKQLATPTVEGLSPQTSNPVTSSPNYFLGRNGNWSGMNTWKTTNSSGSSSSYQSSMDLNSSSCTSRTDHPDSKETIRLKIHETMQPCVIAGNKIKMLEFSAFLKLNIEPECRKHLFVHIGQSNEMKPIETIDIQQICDKFPQGKKGLKDLYSNGPAEAFYLVKFWGDINVNIPDDGAVYGVSSCYESDKNMKIEISSGVCSFGKQVVEKRESRSGTRENGRIVYRITDSQLCEYMVVFIDRLRSLPEKYMMNNVLENFTVLQVVTNEETKETLLCIAFIFEVSSSEHGAQYCVYRLTMG